MNTQHETYETGGAGTRTDGAPGLDLRDHIRRAAADPSQLTFLERYYQSARFEEHPGLIGRDLVALAESHRQFAAARATTYAVRILRRADMGTAALEVAAPDFAFLSESILAALHEMRITLDSVLAPVLESPKNLGRELWLHIEIGRRLTVEEETAVRTRVSEVVADVETASVHASALQACISALRGVSAGGGTAELGQFIDWLLEGRFLLLGYAEPEPVAMTRSTALVPPDASTLVCRELAPGLAIGRSTTRSNVYRRDFIDCIEVRDGHPEGQGIHRFFGVFTQAAGLDPISRLPMVEAKVREATALDSAGPAGEPDLALSERLNHVPRAELFRAPPEHVERLGTALRRVVVGVTASALVRLEPDASFAYCLIYMPHDWHSSRTLMALESEIRGVFHVASMNSETRPIDSRFSQSFLTLQLRPGCETPADQEFSRLEQRLVEVAIPWRRRVELLLAESGHDAGLAEVFSSDYSQTTDPETAVEEAIAIAGLLAADSIPAVAVLSLSGGRDGGSMRALRLFSPAPLALADLLPALSGLGVVIQRERSWSLSGDGEGGCLVELQLQATAWSASTAPDRVFLEAFAAVAVGDVAPDRLNRLVLAAGLTWTEIEVLRSYVHYLRQLDSTYSHGYMADVLVANAPVADLLVEMFDHRFNPALGLTPAQRAELAERDQLHLRGLLDEVGSAEGDRILGGVGAAILATQRTNAFADRTEALGQRPLALKLDARQLAWGPEPRPEAEIFVHSATVEGVHLRFGPVARGGIRWSDRSQDFRTEILGLAKAQTVKNAVIVPTGAKGGFVVRTESDATDADRRCAGREAYRLFVEALLNLTDNLERTPDQPDRVVHPAEMVCWDGDDPYLVLAADKGTSTLSDTANAIATKRRFWLGDAFASGGSTGYDHKALGITARGVWESVRRHLIELGVDPDHESITTVGIGDMSGDVFGNGMLLSRTIRLVAAFNHRHIFLDPTPNVESAYAERRRLFELPNSSWADYSTSTISHGGGVYQRSASRIPIATEVASALGLPAGTIELTPSELVAAILRAPVDLLWNGGIGTYIKASHETNADAADRANDAVRINGGDLRARVVAEGGNLGVTQLGRIEAARSGVRLNNDAVDNSAGVDCSDLEVNIKIAIDEAIRRGLLAAVRRVPLLRSVSDDVTHRVLTDNYEQNRLLTNERATSHSLLPAHAQFMRQLEHSGRLNRAVDQLPDEAQMQTRIAEADALTTPELAVLAAHAKLSVKRDLEGSSLVEEPFAEAVLSDYFPAAVCQIVDDSIRTHPLRRGVVATVLANEVINVGGITFVSRACDEMGIESEDVVRYYAIASVIFDVRRLRQELRRLEGSVPPAVLTSAHDEIRRLMDRAVRWFAQRQFQNESVAELRLRFAPAVSPLLGATPRLVVGAEREAVSAQVKSLVDSRLPTSLAVRVAGLLYEFRALDIAELSKHDGAALESVISVYMTISERYDIARLLQRIALLPRDGRWHALARTSLRADLEQVVSEMTRKVMDTGEANPRTAVERWEATAASSLQRARAALQDAERQEQDDFAAIAVAIRLYREAVMRS